MPDPGPRRSSNLARSRSRVTLVAFRRSFAARAQELVASYAFNEGTGASIAVGSGIGNVGMVSERVSPSVVSSAGVAASRGVVTVSDTQPAGIAHAPVVVE